MLIAQIRCVLPLRPIPRLWVDSSQVLGGESAPIFNIRVGRRFALCSGNGLVYFFSRFSPPQFQGIHVCPALYAQVFLGDLQTVTTDR